jgi:hypothetical protein
MLQSWLSELKLKVIRRQDYLAADNLFIQAEK